MLSKTAERNEKEIYGLYNSLLFIIMLIILK